MITPCVRLSGPCTLVHKSVPLKFQILAACLLPLLAAKANAQSLPHAALQQNCAVCHNDKLKSGGLALTALDLDHPEHTAKDWEKAILQIRAGMMPPAGIPRDVPAINGLADYLEKSIDHAAARVPTQANPPSTA